LGMTRVNKQWLWDDGVPLFVQRNDSALFHLPIFSDPGSLFYF
jgi:hypothetical protein